MKVVIFAGGAGTRLWPLSRKKSPKQFEKIIGEKSTLQLAVERLTPDFAWSDLFVSTGVAYANIVTQQLPKLSKKQVIGEPEMRDVGPAVGLMTAILRRVAPGEPMVILWSDHLVKKEKEFRSILKSAADVIHKKPNTVIFIAQRPRFASENLGWIAYGKKSAVSADIPFYEFVDFQYKPDGKTAKKYLESGHHAWNVGYFVTTPKFLWSQYERFAPNLATGLSKIAKTWGTKEFEKTLTSIYPTLEKIHFDNAILEKLAPKDALVAAEDIGWSDVGAWESLKEALQEAKDKNVTQGKVLLTDTQDSLVYNFTDQMIATIDLDDMLVVNTNDVVLVCKKSSVGKIKTLVERLSGTENDHLT